MLGPGAAWARAKRSAKVAAVEADIAVERMKLAGRISPILTADQKEKIKAFEAKIDDLVDTLINRVGERLGGE